MISEPQSEAASLRRIFLYDKSDQGCKLEKSIVQVLHDQRCVRRVASVTALFPLLALAAVAYGMLLQENFPYNGFELVFRVLCELGLAALFCLVGLAGLLTLYRKRLHRLRKEGLRLVVRLLESHLGKPPILSSRSSQQVIEGGETFQNASEVMG